MKSSNKNQKRIERHQKVRTRVSGTAEKPRLTVFRSNGRIYAQLINDEAGATLAAASDLASNKAAGKGKEKAGPAKSARAKAVGLELAKKAVGLGIKKAVFDRGGYLYAGRVKELAEGAREGGLEF